MLWLSPQSLCSHPEQQGSHALDPPIWAQLTKLAHQPCSEAIIRDVWRQVATVSVVPSYRRAQDLAPSLIWGEGKHPWFWVMSLPCGGWGGISPEV